MASSLYYYLKFSLEERSFLLTVLQSYHAVDDYFEQFVDDLFDTLLSRRFSPVALTLTELTFLLVLVRESSSYPQSLYDKLAHSVSDF